MAQIEIAVDTETLDAKEQRIEVNEDVGDIDDAKDRIRDIALYGLIRQNPDESWSIIPPQRIKKVTFRILTTA